MKLDTNVDHEVCRCCGFEGKEVTERVRVTKDTNKHWPHKVEWMHLCDLCACVGPVCSGRDGGEPATVRDLSAMLRAVLEKIDSTATP